MQLYQAKRAPNPRRVRWAMAEKGITDIELVDVNLAKGDHMQPAYRRLTGANMVPALVLDDGAVITESVAICRYLESIYPEPNLFGRDAKEQAQIEMWLRRAEMLLVTPLQLSMLHSVPALKFIEPNQSPELAAVMRRSAEEGFDLLEERLGESPFIGGDRITIADIVAVIVFEFAAMVKVREPSTDRPNHHRWLAEMRARPAWAISQQTTLSSECKEGRP